MCGFLCFVFLVARVCLNSRIFVKTNSQLLYPSRGFFFTRLSSQCPESGFPRRCPYRFDPNIYLTILNPCRKSTPFPISKTRHGAGRNVTRYTQSIPDMSRTTISFLNISRMRAWGMPLPSTCHFYLWVDWMRWIKGLHWQITCTVWAVAYNSFTHMDLWPSGYRRPSEWDGCGPSFRRAWQD